MASPPMLGYVVFALLNVLIQAQKKVPPTVDGSYKAMGELVENLPNLNDLIVQVAFQETFDVDTGNAAFTIWELGEKLTFIEDNLSNQTLRYVDDSECKIITKTDWVEVKSPPSLSGFENPNGTIRFSLKQLFDLDLKYLVKKNAGASALYRGIPANMWVYKLNGTEEGTRKNVTINAYWSDSTWATTSIDKVVPLGYKISTNYESNDVGKRDIVQNINVFAFIHDVVDKKVFQPIEGVYCLNRTHPYKFPKLPKLQAVTFKSEFILSNGTEIRTIDTWYDMQNQMLRLDLDRIVGQTPVYMRTGRKISTLITSSGLDATFQIDLYRSVMTCNVYSTADNYTYDYQDLINPKLKKWSMDSFFGLNTTSYVYIGKTYKRNIPCHLFQGLRKDWPDASFGITSLWEWCFAMNLSSTDEEVIFRDGGLGLVNVNIKITESKNYAYPVNYRVTHHFYDVMMQDSATLDATAFDISYCFSGNQSKWLQFTVDTKIDMENIDVIENATSDVQFLRLWKEAIYKSTDLPTYTMRVAKVASVVYENKLYISFLLLGAHEDLPESTIHSQISIDSAYEFLGDAINKGELSISYKPSKTAEFMVMKAVKNSLVDKIDKTKTNETTTTTSTTLSTKSGGSTQSSLSPKSPRPTDSLSTSPLSSSTIPFFTAPGSSGTGSEKDTDSTGTGSGKGTGSTSEVTPGPTSKPVKISGHPPGTVAGVSVFMLLMGITVGAGGTFYKYKGIPNCRR